MVLRGMSILRNYSFFILIARIFKKIKYSYLNRIVNPQTIRSQLRLERELRSIADELPDKSLNVYFVFTQSELWGLQSVYEEFDRSDGFQPYVVVMPNTEDKVNSYEVTFINNLKNFENLGVKSISGLDSKNEIVTFKTISKNKPCIVFFDQPYPNLPEDWSFFNVSKNALICYVPYGFKVANDYQGHFNQSIHNVSWRVFCETEWHYQQFRENGRRQGSNVIISGYPKFDSVKNNYKDLECFLGAKSLSASQKKIIVWAPHWSIRDTYLGYSTFDKYYKYFLRLLTDQEDIFWVFRPHQRLKYQLVESGFMNSDEVDKYYRAWDERQNAVYYQGSDYLNLFQHTSGLITDSGSFLAEYLITEMPVLLLNSGKSVGYNELGQRIVKAYYLANTSFDIDGFLTGVIKNGNDLLAEERMRLSSLIKIPENDTSAELIVSHIKSSICTRKG